MKKYNFFFPDVLPEVPGCPPEVAEREIRNTVIEFCEKSLIHQVTLDPITLRANLSDYFLDAPGGSRVHKIMKAFFRGQPIPPIAPDEIANPETYNPRIGGYIAPKSQPTAYTQIDFQTVSFIPIPDQAYPNAVTMRVALSPLRDSEEFEDFLFEQWGEAIACGAKARIMVKPGKPYTNPDAATVNQARYVSGLNDARQRATRGNVRSDLRVQLRRNP
jgi:hypothetical protein